MMRSVDDRYTVFLTPKEFAGLNQDLDGGDFGGTGIVIQIDDKTKYIVVENVVPDGPADKAGIEQDDLITAIDGTSTKGMTLAASQRQAARQGRHARHAHARARRHAVAGADRDHAREDPPAQRLREDASGKIGYVALTVFGRDTGEELNAALADCSSKARARSSSTCATTAAAISKLPSRVARSSFRAARSFRSNRAPRTSRRSKPTTRRSRRCRSSCSSTATPPRPRRSPRARFRTAASARSSARRHSAKASCKRSIRCPTDQRDQDHDGALSHPAQPRHQPSRHYAGRRGRREQARAVRQSRQRRTARRARCEYLNAKLARLNQENDASL